MNTTAAVLVEVGKPLELFDLEIPSLKPGQVLVDIAWSGVCHTQVLECRGYRGVDKFLPHCLGHEGSGTVAAIAEGVNKVKVGERVVMSWIKGLGFDVPGTVYQTNGRKVNAGGITTFSNRAIISENRLTVISSDIDARYAALLGCAVPTGVGAVLNTARPRPGQSLVVFGVGGIGLCAIAGGVIASCFPVIAVDVQPQKLELARTMGATHVILSSSQDPVAEIQRLVKGGVDFALEATGNPLVMQQAVESVRSQGGTAVIIGNARHGQRVDLDPNQLNQGKRILGTWGGDNLPDRDYPRYCRLLQSGKLNVAPLLSKTYSLAGINDAIDALEAGVVARPLIDMSLQ
jgi:S-(hydroxymethyl)glutathione dehydrogenase/alcohol dehydrogenase